MLRPQSGFLFVGTFKSPLRCLPPSRSRRGRFDVAEVLRCLALIGGFSGSASAQFIEPPQPQYGWREMWSGADASKDVWLLYSGVTLAPLSKDIHSEGLRLRAAGGYGQYSYNQETTLTTANCGASSAKIADQCTYTTRKGSPKKFVVDHHYIEALAGYQMRFGELTAKAFVGIASVAHNFNTVDEHNSEVSGEEIGVKGSVELWYNLNPNAWTSFNASYTTAHETGAAHWRLGWRVIPTLSIGPELRFDRTVCDNGGRVGAFARYEWLGGEISIAGGAGRTVYSQCVQETVDGVTVKEDHEISPYGSLNYLVQF